MSETAQKQRASDGEILGRIAEYRTQRDAALERCTLLAGEKAALLDLLAESSKTIQHLEGLVKHLQAPADTGAAADDPTIEVEAIP